MDTARFDALSRALAAQGTRRAALGALLGLPLAAAGLPHDAEASSKASRRTRKRRAQGEHFNHRKSTFCLNGKTFRAKRRKRASLLAQGATLGKCPTCAGGASAPCLSGQTCCASGCADVQTDAANCGACGAACAPGQTCASGRCQIPCVYDLCDAATEICADQQCQPCDVTCTAVDHVCDGASLQAAISTREVVVVCPGRYTGAFTSPGSKTVTVIGAGAGNNPAIDTILDAQGAKGVTTVTLTSKSTTTLRSLRVTGGAGCGGGVRTVFSSTLTLNACTVADNASICEGGGIYAEDTTTLFFSTVERNTATSGGGLFYRSPSNLQPNGLSLSNTTVRMNTAQQGGGIYADNGQLSLLTGTVVTENTATQAQGGGGVYGGMNSTYVFSGQTVSNNDPDQCRLYGTFIVGVCGP
ncbi:MAG: hypothetical protein QM692_23855 [Thermomicrobiales bacterium]